MRKQIGVGLAVAALWAAPVMAQDSTYGGDSIAGLPDYYVVQPGDTLWEIAQRVRPDNSVSMNQVMLALQDLNPDAFINGNINRLKRGEVLRVPDIDDIRARTQAQANGRSGARCPVHSSLGHCRRRCRRGT